MLMEYGIRWFKRFRAPTRQIVTPDEMLLVPKES
jgi:hypothetical protein